MSYDADRSDELRELYEEDNPDGAELLDEIRAFLSRFVVYPSQHELTAHALWIAHTWFMECWDSTPRIAFLSPEPGSGKSRALEVTEPLVPNPIHAVNTTPAYLFRKVAETDEDGKPTPPTILYDEIDTVFGPKAKDNEDIRGMLNAGHRRGAIAGRCVMRGKNVETEDLPAYCAVALAGLDDLPDTLMSRSVVCRMRRRAPGEPVEPWRQRVNGPEAATLYRRLIAWSNGVEPLGGGWPTLPLEVTDRDADVWEALIAVADLAGGDWPETARVAAVTLVTASRGRKPSLGVLLLQDIRTAFSAGGQDKMTTLDLLCALNRMDESPWGSIRRGEPLDARGLASRLNKYGIGSKAHRTEGTVMKGYSRTQFEDAWSRYLSPDSSVTSVTAETALLREPETATGVTAVTGPQQPIPLDVISRRPDCVCTNQPRACTYCEMSTTTGSATQ
ncbi:DUF3631 domain-containing protein [Mycobacterium asiaticum]|uniref:DUF3631 domain-containing protein n=1 Tax=Mycobacterium asiaticum TaxID=1790 RepID=UPI0009C0E833|nr:DUF3631 domain-containing protein [Mycobacterium asiaticum]